MGRVAFAPENALLYLEKFADNKQNVIGLILGQASSSEDEIVHLARTPEEKAGEQTAINDAVIISDKILAETQFSSISENWVADHAKHVTRMLPGGLFVLGIFTVSSEDVFSNSVILGKLKNVLIHLNKTLAVNKYMYGNCNITSDRLIINFSHHTRKATAKVFDIGKTPTTAFKHVDLKFHSKPFSWQQFDCYFEFDEIYPVVVKKNGISVKEQFQQIMDAAHKSVESSIILFDGKLNKGSDTLESLKKTKNKTATKANSPDESKNIQVSMFVPCEAKSPDSVEYLECEGTTHFSGVVASRVFINCKATVEDAMTAIKQDVIRSLASRFTMHCDALIDDNLLPEEKVCFNEPPRRVLIKLPNCGDSKVFLCDYLFPGESPIEALVSVKEMLDANISEDDVICNIETPADTAEFDALDKEPGSEEMLTTPQDANKSLYVIGIGIALFILMISIFIQYFDKIRKIFS